MSSNLNKNFDDQIGPIFLNQGFKKKGVHYFKVMPSEIFGIIKENRKGYFDDYHLVYIHKCAEINFEKIKKSLSSELMLYPVSINVEELELVMDNNNILENSNYWFYSLSRLYTIDKNVKENKRAWEKYQQYKISRNNSLESEQFVSNYLKKLKSTLEKNSEIFFEKCNPELCYIALNRPIIENKRPQYLDYYKELFEQIKLYFEKEKLTKPISNSKNKNSWLNKLFGK